MPAQPFVAAVVDLAKRLQKHLFPVERFQTRFGLVLLHVLDKESKISRMPAVFLDAGAKSIGKFG
jgi:hypothetical protein